MAQNTKPAFALILGPMLFTLRSSVLLEPRPLDHVDDARHSRCLGPRSGPHTAHGSAGQTARVGPDD